MKFQLIQFKFFRKFFKGKYYKISCIQLSMGPFWCDQEIKSCQSVTIAVEEYKPKKLVLKTGDNVIVYFDHYEVPVTVKGFYCYGMYVTQLGVIPFKAYSFYGAGYTQCQRFITVTKKWHYRFAVMAEWIRLNLTNK